MMTSSEPPRRKIEDEELGMIAESGLGQQIAGKRVKPFIINKMQIRRQVSC